MHHRESCLIHWTFRTSDRHWFTIYIFCISAWRGVNGRMLQKCFSASLENLHRHRVPICFHHCSARGAPELDVKAFTSKDSVQIMFLMKKKIPLIPRTWFRLKRKKGKPKMFVFTYAF